MTSAGLAAELIIEFHAGGGETHRRALCEWARSAGYQRVWFDGEVVELEPAAGGMVRTRCTGCGQRFIDGRSGWFWNNVRRSGTFPVACALCGSDLPQWTPVERTEATTSDTKVRRGPAPRSGERAHQTLTGSANASLRLVEHAPADALRSPGARDSVELVDDLSQLGGHPSRAEAG